MHITYILFTCMYTHAGSTSNTDNPSTSTTKEDDDERKDHRDDSEHSDDSDHSDDSSRATDDGDNDNGEDISYHDEVFEVMGTCVEKRYQDVLTTVEELMADGKAVPVRVEYDLQNPQDVNAIKAEAHINDRWKIFGCIKKNKLPKLTSAMRQGTITECKFASRPKYKLNVLNSGINGLTCALIITNRFRWDRDDNGYRYNDDLSHL